ncbi:restriction endonuclease subunit S [Helicobacter pylori]|nr:restriction endonuclease subunit S [Helicobacter pylori]QDY54710.1 restriction endonuclease subunit S [Helicobacter pylori]
MHKIERLLQTLAPKGVEFRKLGEVCDFQNGFAFQRKNFRNTGLPIIRISNIQNDRLLLDEVIYFSLNDYKGTNFESFKITKGDILIAMSGATTGKIGILTFDTTLYLNQRVGKFKPNITKLNYKFLYYFLKNSQTILMKSQFGAGIPALNKADIETLTIPIPPLEIQQEIVKILDAFTELNTELNTRKKQYEYYQNMLLDFNDINQSHKDAKEKLAQKTYPKRLKTLLHTLAPKGVEFKKIGELFKRNKGINITAAQMKELHSEICKVRIFAGGATKADIDYKDISKKDIINCESVIIKSRGNIGFEYYNQPFSHKNEIWSYSLKTNQMLVKFLYYYLSNNQYYFQKLAQSSSVKLPQLSVSDTDEYEVPVPPLEIQQEIVTILDQFSALTTDLLAGIPAEIKARKKQYEYYREKLLTFKPLTPNKEVKKG